MIGEDKEGQLQKLPMGRLRLPDRPMRNEASPEEIRRLAVSILKHGMLHPILVRPSGRQFEIVCGARRYKACKTLGMGEILAVIRVLDDRQALELSVAENSRREGLSAEEQKELLKRLRTYFPGRSHEELEAWLGPVARVEPEPEPQV